MVHFETEVEKLRLDVLAQKENDKIRQEEMENFFKKASLDYFNKLKDTSERLDKVRQEQLGSGNMGNMINLLEQEIIDLKNQNKTRQMRTGMGDDGSPDQSIASRIDLLIEEIN